MIKNGNLRVAKLKPGHLVNPDPRQGPFCTHWQFIRYVNDSDELIVEIHQYLRPDGTLGASGKPDPKRLRIGNILYAVRARESSE
jgi:hypothetical protein